MASNNQPQEASPERLHSPHCPNSLIVSALATDCDCLPNPVPDVAKLTDLEIYEITSVHPRFVKKWPAAVALASAATEKAWHSRDAEVAKLQQAFELMLTNRNESNEKLDAIREQVELPIVIHSDYVERAELDAALEQVRRLMLVVGVYLRMDDEDIQLRVDKLEELEEVYSSTVTAEEIQDAE